MMKKIITVLVIFMTMTLALVIQPAVNTHAIENKEMDVVLVLDQSGSMKSNDPDNMMKEAAKKFITMMPSNSRANIITFNRSRSKWKDGLTSLSDDKQTKSATDWIENIKYTGDTDVGNAVADALDMFDVNDGKVHAILVFSDGRNDFGHERNKEVESDERLNDALTIAKNAGVQIYCIGYGKEMVDHNDSPYKKLDSIAIANSTNRITTDTDPDSIDNYFTTVIAELMNTSPIAVVDNKVTISSNVKEANITVTSNSSINDVSLDLIDPDQKKVNFGTDHAKQYKYQNSIVLKLYKPEKGTYTIETNKDVKISAIYIPYYDYTLKSSVLNSSNKNITELSNGEEATIKTCIQQDNKNVTTSDTYQNTKATAVVTAKDTKKSQTITLTYQDNSFVGKVNFDHVATYDIQIDVVSDTFHLTDQLEIKTNKKPISIKKDIDKQTLDKTFKDSDSKVISMKTLKGAIDDPDDVGFKVIKAESTDEDTVSADLTDQGLEITGYDWGSANVTVTYEDKLGNTVDTTFTVKVNDKALLILYASIPFVIGAAALIIAYLIIRRFRLIRGNFTIQEVIVEKDIESYSIGDVRTYPSNIFLMRKKNLATGMSQYASDVYHQSYDDKAEKLYQLLNNDSPIKKALESVVFVGTYLGKNGCIIKIKNPHVSYGNNLRYGVKVKEKWKSEKNFTICIKDDSGLEMTIVGHYAASMFRKKQSFDENMEMFNQNNQSNGANNDGFNDFTF